MHRKVQDARTFKRSLTRVYSAMNPTFGTGIAEAIKTGFAATAATLLIRNGSTGLLLRPKYIRLIYTVAPASATAAHGAIILDTGTTRHSSGGSTLTAYNRDNSSSVTTSATVKYGALVTAAASASVRPVARFQPSSVIMVAGDNLVLAFGQDEAAAAGNGTIAGTTARQIVQNVGQVIVGPSQEMILHLWYPANATTPPSTEVEVTWEESAR